MVKLQKTVYLGQVTDTATNLAIEEYLMETCQEDEIILFLWQSNHTVVIGKHQNPYIECNIPLMNENEVNLIRRKSGGGAVYHDLGNLNFTFIAHENNYNIEKQFTVILNALLKHSITGEINGRNDLTINGHKFSGNAFIYHKNLCCHHGTLLVASDLSELGKYLTPSTTKITSKGVDSVRSRVANLKSFNDTITINSVKDTIVEAFNEFYIGELIHNTLPQALVIENYIQSYKTWEWNFGESPKCDLGDSKKFSWGNFEIGFTIKSGLIKEMSINTDTLIQEPFRLVQQACIGKQAKASSLNEIINFHIKTPIIRRNINEFINELLL